ncbi:MAG TPA: methyl-accepting chemotaxis protein, partial [Candidatus Brocadiia bacterium]|nr:methyl-accepting chemotaxis protein [Candidatus Brocadiia bacterium]
MAVLRRLGVLTLFLAAVYGAHASGRVLNIGGAQLAPSMAVYVFMALLLAPQMAWPSLCALGGLVGLLTVLATTSSVPWAAFPAHGGTFLLVCLLVRIWAPQGRQMSIKRVVVLVTLAVTISWTIFAAGVWLGAPAPFHAKPRDAFGLPLGQGALAWWLSGFLAVALPTIILAAVVTPVLYNAAMSRTVAIKYLAWLGGSVAVALMIFAIYVYGEERSHALKSNDAMARLILSKTNHALARWVEDQTRIARLLGENRRVGLACLSPGDEATRTRAQGFINEVKRLYACYDNIRLLTRMSAGESVTLKGPSGPVTVRGGEVFMDTAGGQTLGPCKVAAQAWRALNIGKDYYLSDAFRSQVGGRPVFLVAAPVVCDGKTVGMVMLTVRLEYFTEAFLGDAPVGARGYLFMLDRRGLIVSHPRKEWILDEKAASQVSGIAELAIKEREPFVAELAGVKKRYLSVQVGADGTGVPMDWFLVSTREMSEIEASAAAFLGSVAKCLLAALVFLTLVTCALTNRLIRQPLSVLMAAADRVSAGDLTVEIVAEPRQDEIGGLQRALAGMTASLRSQTQKIREAVATLNSSATQIAATARRQESVVSGHTATTTEVAAAVTEISATSQELSKTMQNVHEVAKETEGLADTGRAGLQDMGGAMRVLDQATMSVAEKLEVIRDKADNIGAVVTAINKVADQTNLLSLNAAIEAEKAGEYGLGFAVVAREIRRLADQTALATLDISGMVKEMQSSVSSGVMEIDKFTREVKRGVEMADEISLRLERIIERVKDLTPKFVAV